MPALTVYILDSTGAYSHGRYGDIDTITDTVDMLGERYTLTPPPDYDHVWRWIDNKWIADNTAN